MEGTGQLHLQLSAWDGRLTRRSATTSMAGCPSTASRRAFSPRFIPRRPQAWCFPAKRDALPPAGCRPVTSTSVPGLDLLTVPTGDACRAARASFRSGQVMGSTSTRAKRSWLLQNVVSPPFSTSINTVNPSFANPFSPVIGGPATDQSLPGFASAGGKQRRLQPVRS